MLEALRDNPQNYFESQYSANGDGVVSGFEIRINNDSQKISIEPGIAKINGKLFFFTKQTNLEIEDECNYAYLTVTDNMTMSGNIVEPKIVLKKEQSMDDIELFRYTKTEGAKLLEYSDFREVYENYTNRIDRRHCVTSVIGGNIMHFSIFKIYALDMLKKKGISVEDVVFSYNCLNGINDLAMVRQYLGDSFNDIDLSIEKMWMCLKEKKYETDNKVAKQEENDDSEGVICVG